MLQFALSMFQARINVHLPHGWHLSFPIILLARLPRPCSAEIHVVPHTHSCHFGRIPTPAAEARGRYPSEVPVILPLSASLQFILIPRTHTVDPAEEPALGNPRFAERRVLPSGFEKEPKQPDEQ